MTAQPVPPLDPDRPFTLEQWRTAGRTLRELQTTPFRRLHKNVYVAAGAPSTPAQRTGAALLTVPKPSYGSHVSGARLLGVPVPTIPDEHITVLRARDRRANPGIVCHCRPGRTPVLYVDGIPVSTYTQLFIELATLLPLVDLVAAGDHMVYKQHLTVEQLADYCAGRKGPGAVFARRAAGYVRAKVESVMESKLRMLLVLAGLPEPEIQWNIRDERGILLRRYDLAYPGQRIAIEYDGKHHLEDATRARDLERREESDEDEWRLIVVLAAGIYTEPARTLERVHRVARKRRVPGVPARLRDDWRSHFPGR